MNNIVRGMIAGFAATVVLSAIMVMKEMMGVMPDLDIARMLGGMLVGLFYGLSLLLRYFGRLQRTPRYAAFTPLAYVPRRSRRWDRHTTKR